MHITFCSSTEALKALKRALLSSALIAFAIGTTSRTSLATNYPNLACPDSTGMIFRIQSVPAITCSPALGDTVRGVGGIIIGFDPIATGFDAFIQNTGGGPFSGIDFFTGSVNTKAAPYNWAIGDSIIIEAGKTAEFGGLTEILAPNSLTSSPNWIARKVSSGNALPPFFEGTTTQLKETPTNTTAEQYEGCLVKINGPLTVVRTSLTGGMGTNNSFLLISASAPSDSVFVEGNKLTTYAPPGVGTVIQSVQGVLGQTTRGYRIWLRDGNDIVAATPPNVTDGYPLSDNVIRVTFDRNVTSASATNVANYSLASLGSVDAAAMDGTDAVQLTITNGLAHGVLETVTINGIVSSALGLAMTSPQSRTFVNGLLTAADVQQANPDTLFAECWDKSRIAGAGGQSTAGLSGPRASMSGTAFARYNNLYYVGDAGNPTRGGVAVSTPPTILTLGHRYRLVGNVQEFFGETRLTSIVLADDLGPEPPITSVVVSLADVARDVCDFSDATTDGEDFEGRLVTIRNAMVVQRTPIPPTNGFYIADPASPDTLFVDNYNNVLSPLVAPAPGERVTVTGVVHYSGGFRIAPRSYADLSREGFYYRLNTTPAPNGTITRTPEYAYYSPNDSVTLTAQPDPGFEFMQWTGDTTATSNPMTFSLARDMTVTAVFDSVGFTLSLSAGPHGQILRNPIRNRYAPGATVQLIALPDAGYRFSSWSGDLSAVSDTLTLQMHGSLALQASFVFDATAAAGPLEVHDHPLDQGGFVDITWPASPMEMRGPNVVCCYPIQRRNLGQPTSAWVTVATIPGTGASRYHATVATSQDSSALNSGDQVYRLLTRLASDSTLWASDTTLGHSADNIAPPAIAAVSGTIASGTATFFWSAVSASDLSGYRVYRGPTADFVTDANHRIGFTTEPGFSDYAGNFNFYKVTAVDSHDNEGPATMLHTLNATDVHDGPRSLPVRVEMGDPRPSPSATGFHFELGLPQERLVRAEVVDLSGRVVRTLHYGRMAAGWKALFWDSHDDRGIPSASGLYFLRVEVGGSEHWTRRMVLIH